MLNRLTKTKRKDASKISETDIKKIRNLYYKDGIKTDELCRIYRVGKIRIINILNGDKNEIGGYCDRDRKKVSGGGDPEEAPEKQEDPLENMEDIVKLCQERVKDVERNKNERLEWLESKQ